MLSIGKLTASRAAYYTDQLPGGADEYYTHTRAEETGVWLGTASALLGLAGTVAPDDFRAVLDAQHPATGESLGVPRTTKQRLAGFDLCFSAPKSVSLAWALGSLDTAAMVAGAHDRAVAAAVEAFEVEVVRARRGAGGRDSVETAGVVAAGFAHRTSRAGDPQIHTHLVVANLTPDETDRWSAVDGTRVYRWAKTLGYLYQAQLRAELTTALGVEWGPVRKGAADLASVDTRSIEAFSKRAAEIANATGGTVGLPLAVAKTATLSTRAAKSTVPDLATLRLRWRDEAANLGITELLPTPDAQARPGPHRPQSTVDLGRLTPGLLGPEGLTANSSTFDRRDLLQALAAAHPDGATISGLRHAADEMIGHPDVVTVDTHPTHATAAARYSTTELLEVEQRLLDRAYRSRQAGRGVTGETARRTALTARPTLSPEQAGMVESLTTSGAGVEVIVGRAGSGKTYALDAARAAWETSGHTVIGAALAARAAAELQAGAGIPATTIDRLLADLDRPGPLTALPPRTVIVVDEAGMVGTRKLARLLEHAERHQAKVVLVGDHRQLPEIQAGGAFAALTRVVTVSELTDNRRQSHHWERAALSQLRDGNIAQAFDAYDRSGRVTLVAGADQARQVMVADWWQARRSGERAAMYALRRIDVNDLNRRARDHLDRAGLLGTETITTAGREFAAGDQVICGRNDRRLGVRNGTIDTIAAVHTDTGEVTLAGGTRLGAGYLEAGHLAHGYATTIHKAQGATVDRAFLLGSEGLYREAGYVGLSRARQSTRLYIVAPDTPRRDPLDVDPVVETIRRLGVSRAQTLAGGHPPADLTPDPRRHRALLADPQPWLVETLGPPPLSGPDRDRWARTAERITAYRDIYNIADTTDPLGPRPEHPGQRRAWDLAQLAVTDHQRSIDIDQGLHR